MSAGHGCRPDEDPNRAERREEILERGRPPTSTATTATAIDDHHDT